MSELTDNLSQGVGQSIWHFILNISLASSSHPNILNNYAYASTDYSITLHINDSQMKTKIHNDLVKQTSVFYAQ